VGEYGTILYKQNGVWSSPSTGSARDPRGQLTLARN
jgi:hypothetical protein